MANVLEKCHCCSSAAAKVYGKLDTGMHAGFDPSVLLPLVVDLIKFFMDKCQPADVKKNAGKKNPILRLRVRHRVKQSLGKHKADESQIDKLTDAAMKTAAEATEDEIEGAYLEVSLLPDAKSEEE